MTLSRGIRGSLVLLALAAGAVLMLGPFVWMVLSSFKPVGEITRFPPTLFPEDPTLENYIEVFRRAPMGRYYANSIYISTVTTVSVVFTSTIAGYTFAKHRFPGRDLLFLMILSTMMLPPATRIIPHFMIMNALGWVDTYQGLIAPTMVSAFGIFLARQFSYSIPDEMLDSGRIDGCSEFRLYFSLVLPTIRPAIATLVIFEFMNVWNALLWPVVIVNSPELRPLPLGVAMFSDEFTTFFGLTMAASALVIAPVVIVFLIFQRQFIQGIALTGMK